jgi:hypothetical protein
MPDSKKHIVHLNAGEWSPKVYDRVDHEKYPAACRTAKNVIPIPHGALVKRKGMQMEAPAKYDDQKCAFIEFQFSRDQTYAVEVGELYMRFFDATGQLREAAVECTGITAASPALVTAPVHGYSNGDEIYIDGLTEMTELNGRWVKVVYATLNTFRITDRDGTLIDSSAWTAETSTTSSLNKVYEIVSPYTAAQAFELDYVQKDDVVWITHEDLEPRRLIRFAETNWTISVIDYAFPPMLDYNAEDTHTLEIDDLDMATSSTVTAVGFSPFTADLVGSYWAMSHIESGKSETFGIFTTYVPTTYFRVINDWNITTTGTWKATVELYRSLKSERPSSPFDISEWEVIEVLSSFNDANYNISGDQEGEQRWFSVGVTQFTSNLAGVARFRVPSQEIVGFFQVDSFTSATEVDVTIKKEIYSTDPTLLWAEGAWSEENGYPRAVAFFETRIWFAGSKHQPQGLWASEVSVYDNFQVDVNDDDPLAIELSSQERNEILWLADQEKLLVGTSGGEWTIAGTDLNSIISPTNIVARRQESNGSSLIRPIMVNEVVVYVQRSSRKIREFGYDLNRDRYHGTDLMLFSEHLARGGFVTMAFAGNPYPLLWVNNGNGELLCMTYEKDQNVYGWTRMETNGLVESVETVYGATSDQVYVVVKRTINGTTRRFIEKIDGSFDTNFYDTDQELEDAKVFSDCSSSHYSATAFTSVSGLHHLNGEAVVALADGVVVEGLTVTDGTVDLPTAANTAHVGLNYEARISPISFDMDGAVGITQSITKRVTRVFARFIDTLGLKYRNLDDSTKQPYELEFREGSDPMDAPVPLFTGEKELQLRTGYSKDPIIEIISDQPLPFTLRSLHVHYEVTEK